MPPPSPVPRPPSPVPRPPSPERLKENISAIELLRTRYVTTRKEILKSRITATGVLLELLNTELEENARAIASADHARACLRE